MIRNPAVLVGVFVALVGVGFAAGFTLGQRRAVEEGRASLPAPSTPSGTAGRSERSTTPSTRTEPGLQNPERLRERIVELEAELRVLRQESGGKPTVAAEAEVAGQAFEDLLAMETGNHQDPEQLRLLIDHLAKLDERSAKHFIVRFRRALSENGSDDEKKVALQLALMSGGPDTADFVQQMLTDATLEARLRDSLISELATRGGGSFFSIRRLPVDERLASTAFELVHSDRGEERHAGASLLGGVRSAASNGELLRLLQDPDAGVRQIAARSLGMIGDRNTRAILEPYATQTQDAGLQKAAAAAIREIDRTAR